MAENFPGFVNWGPPGGSPALPGTVPQPESWECKAGPPQEIRPAIKGNQWLRTSLNKAGYLLGGVALGGGTLNSHDISLEFKHHQYLDSM